jgi:hypothetical protein
VRLRGLEETLGRISLEGPPPVLLLCLQLPTPQTGLCADPKLYQRRQAQGSWWGLSTGGRRRGYASPFCPVPTRALDVQDPVSRKGSPTIPDAGW